MKAIIGEPHNNLNVWLLFMQDIKRSLKNKIFCNRVGTQLKLTKMQEILFRTFGTITSTAKFRAFREKLSVSHPFLHNAVKQCTPIRYPSIAK